MFSESLTVRILGDSSQLRQELTSTESLLETFQERLTSLANAGEQLGKLFAGLSRLTTPLQAVSKLIGQLTQQVRLLSETPVTLNVQPALAALQRLSGAIDQVAARLRMIAISLPVPTGAFPVFGGVGGGGPGGGPLPGLPPKLSPAGLSGLDASPVLNVIPARDHSLTQSMERLPRDVTGLDRPVPGAAASSVTNHFGGITLNVREVADVERLMRDFRLRGIHLRNRRG